MVQAKSGFELRMKVLVVFNLHLEGADFLLKWFEEQFWQFLDLRVRLIRVRAGVHGSGLGLGIGRTIGIGLLAGLGYMVQGWGWG